MRIAIVGAYGNGKTTLGTELARRTGLPLLRGAPMRDPVGSAGRPLEECTEPELIQLTIRRFAERAVAEALAPDGFISDGSVLHEWAYARVRLALGLHPEPPASLATASRSARTAVYEKVADQIGLLAGQHAADGYDGFLRLRSDLPLRPGDRPVSGYFRVVSDQILAAALAATGRPVSLITGSLDERVRAGLELIQQCAAAR
jgi:hypothetical protein